MKLKYYLRGLGIGIIVTTIILVSCFSMQKPKMTDEQIIEKAAQLGMIMPEQNSAVIAETETTEPEETEQKNEQQIAAEKLQPLPCTLSVFSNSCLNVLIFPSIQVIFVPFRCPPVIMLLQIFPNFSQAISAFSSSAILIPVNFSASETFGVVRMAFGSKYLSRF